MLKTRIILQRPILRDHCLNRIRNLCTPSSGPTEDDKEKELQRIAESASIDEPPTTCCQSGCANCVYVVWAEALTAKMQHAGPEITDKILQMVQDPSMKAYLEMELRMRLKK